jgi:hypothetical protein
MAANHRMLPCSDQLQESCTSATPSRLLAYSQIWVVAAVELWHDWLWNQAHQLLYDKAPGRRLVFVSTVIGTRVGSLTD